MSNNPCVWCFYADKENNGEKFPGDTESSGLCARHKRATLAGRPARGPKQHSGIVHSLDVAEPALAMTVDPLAALAFFLEA
jgi:hypothetical protein